MHMERPERYDPEDLEHLMLERGFDELLEEERAYALRHLADRAEYERMRALLHHVREERDESLPGDAGPAVRERVLQAFRAQRQPQWRIWLNSVGGLLLPARPATFARPLLALGTVAALMIGSLALWNAMRNDGDQVLAEVKQENSTPTVRAPAGTVDKTEPAPPVETITADAMETERGQAIVTPMPAEEEAEAPSPVLANAEQRAADAPRQQGMEADRHVQAADLEQLAEKQAPAATGTAMDAVRSAPVATAKQEKRGGRTRMAADEAFSEVAAETTVPAHREDELLGLLRAAW